MLPLPPCWLFTHPVFACFAYLQVHRRIVESLLQLVESERSGEAINRHLLKRAVGMLSALRLYEDGVQDTLLSSAVQYYSREGAALINVSGTGGEADGGGMLALVPA